MRGGRAARSVRRPLKSAHAARGTCPSPPVRAIVRMDGSSLGVIVLCGAAAAYLIMRARDARKHAASGTLSTSALIDAAAQGDAIRVSALLRDGADPMV